MLVDGASGGHSACELAASGSRSGSQNQFTGPSSHTCCVLDFDGPIKEDKVGSWVT